MLGFLRSPVRTVQGATVRTDVRPHLVPIWFDIDKGPLVFTTWHKTAKSANLRRDLRICLSVDDQVSPFSFVQPQGTVSLGTDPDQLLYCGPSVLTVGIWGRSKLKPTASAMACQARFLFVSH